MESRWPYDIVFAVRLSMLRQVSHQNKVRLRRVRT